MATSIRNSKETQGSEDEATEAVAILLVLTPDDVRPAELAKLSDARVAWTSFSLLDQAIDELLEDKYEVVSEREAFLLRALQLKLEAGALRKSYRF